MKKGTILILGLALLVAFNACKNSQKKEIKAAEGTYKVVDTTATIKWTAYKTTEKLPVSGVFNTINIKKSASGITQQSALDNLEFSIPVSSLFSNNEERDTKLNAFFFAVMQNTNLLTGTIHVGIDNTGILDLTMNGLTNSLALTFTNSDDTIHFKGLMQLDKLNIDNALASLNKACFDLHKGKDGISKTWNEVLIEASVVVSK